MASQVLILRTCEYIRLHGSGGSKAAKPSGADIGERMGQKEKGILGQVKLRFMTVPYDLIQAQMLAELSPSISP